MGRDTVGAIEQRRPPTPSQPAQCVPLELRTSKNTVDDSLSNSPKVPSCSAASALRSVSLVSTAIMQAKKICECVWGGGCRRRG